MPTLTNRAGPAQLPIGAGPVGMQTRMPAVTNAAASRCLDHIALTAAPNPLPGPPPPRPRAIPTLTNRAGPVPVADRRRAGRDADADAGGILRSMESLKTIGINVGGRALAGGGAVPLTQDMKDAAKALELPLAKTALTLKQIYADAPGQAAVVWQLGARGREAADEVRALFREVLPEACARKPAKRLLRKAAR